MTWRAAAAALLVACAGCGRGSDVGARDAEATGRDAGRVAPRQPPAPTDAADGGLLARSLPRIAYRGGDFLRRPRVVVVTFPGESAPLVQRLGRFGETIVRSAWWRAVTEGYCAAQDDCIGEGSSASVTLPPSVAITGETTTEAVAAMLAKQAAAGAFGRIDANTLLVAFLPKGTTLKSERFCHHGKRGTHAATTMGDARLAYAIVPRCSDDEGELTGTASHEILEATTNPDEKRRGFAFMPGPEAGAFTAAGVEPVDPCGLVTMDTHRAFESGFVIHRAWSNRNAAAGREPCVPAPADRPFVSIVPRQRSVVLYRVGDSVTVMVDASTTSDVAAWAVSGFDLTGWFDKERYVDVSIDTPTIARGAAATVTITLRKAHPDGRSIIGLVSTVGVYSFLWPVRVNTK